MSVSYHRISLEKRKEFILSAQPKEEKQPFYFLPTGWKKDKGLPAAPHMNDVDGLNSHKSNVLGVLQVPKPNEKAFLVGRRQSRYFT